MHNLNSLLGGPRRVHKICLVGLTYTLIKSVNYSIGFTCIKCDLKCLNRSLLKETRWFVNLSCKQAGLNFVSDGPWRIWGFSYKIFVHTIIWHVVLIFNPSCKRLIKSQLMQFELARKCPKCTRVWWEVRERCLRPTQNCSRALRQVDQFNYLSF